MRDHAPSTPAQPRRRLWGVARKGVLWVLVLYGLWLGVLWIAQDRLIFPAHAAWRPHVDPAGAGASVLTLPSGVYGWLLPPAGATPGADAPAPLAVLMHGNAEVIETWYDSDEARTLRALGWWVLVPEYRGYGGAPGSPAQEGIVADTLELVELALAQGGVDAGRTIYLGRSLGGGVACALAQRRAPAAMILESTFTSVSRLAWRFGAPPALVRHPFVNDEFVARTDLPLLIFHGERDHVVPVGHGRTLARLARNGRYIEVPCGHADFPPDARAYRREVGAFLLDHGLVPDATSPAR